LTTARKPISGNSKKISEIMKEVQIMQYRYNKKYG